MGSCCTRSPQFFWRGPPLFPNNLITAKRSSCPLSLTWDASSQLRPPQASAGCVYATPLTPRLPRDGAAHLCPPQSRGVSAPSARQAWGGDQVCTPWVISFMSRRHKEVQLFPLPGSVCTARGPSGPPEGGGVGQRIPRETGVAPLYGSSRLARCLRGVAAPLPPGTGRSLSTKHPCGAINGLQRSTSGSPVRLGPSYNGSPGNTRQHNAFSEGKRTEISRLRSLAGVVPPHWWGGG